MTIKKGICPVCGTGVLVTTLVAEAGPEYSENGKHHAEGSTKARKSGKICLGSVLHYKITDIVAYEAAVASGEYYMG